MSAKQEPRDLAALKQELRKSLSSRRLELSADEQQNASLNILARAQEVLSIPQGLVISGYVPIRAEIDIVPVLDCYRQHGHTIALPLVTGSGRPLMFREWKLEDPLKPGAFGVSTPEDSAPELVPDILFVPLLAFDAKGYRLGYGGGYYDRTLRALRQNRDIVAIGTAYSFQGPQAIPIHDGDEALDGVLTPDQFFRTGLTDNALTIFR